MTVVTGMLAVTDVTDRTRFDMTRRGVTFQISIDFVEHSSKFSSFANHAQLNSSSPNLTDLPLNNTNPRCESNVVKTPSA